MCIRDRADTANAVRALDVTTRGGQGGWLVVVTGAADRDVLGRLVGVRGFAPITVFDVSGWPDAAETPGIVTIRGATAQDAVGRWNGLS